MRTNDLQNKLHDFSFKIELIERLLLCTPYIYERIIDKTAINTSFEFVFVSPN